MNIGIIYYSETGNTKKFADVISNSLKKAGHIVEQTEVKTDIPVNSRTIRENNNYKVVNMPDCKKYDYIFIGGPVWGFSINTVTVKAIEELKELNGKIVVPFVTQFFPFPFLGGGHSIKQIGNAAEKHGAKTISGLVLNRAWHDAEKSMKEKADSVIPLIK